MGLGDVGLNELITAASGSGKGFWDSIAGDLAGLWAGLGVLRPEREAAEAEPGIDPPETFREWPGDGFLGI